MLLDHVGRGTPTTAITPRLTAHKIRHGVASIMLANGWSMKVIAEQLGNTERVASTTYAHLTPDLSRRAVEALNVRRKDSQA